MAPCHCKIEKLHDLIRRLERKLRKAECQEAKSSQLLLELAAENQRIRNELQDAVEEGEAAAAFALTVKEERDQYHVWWIQELNTCQYLHGNSE
jgi:peptidoglycan hydrolase CwlO-like protein